METSRKRRRNQENTIENPGQESWSVHVTQVRPKRKVRLTSGPNSVGAPLGLADRWPARFYNMRAYKRGQFNVVFRWLTTTLLGSPFPRNSMAECRPVKAMVGGSSPLAEVSVSRSALADPRDLISCSKSPGALHLGENRVYAVVRNQSFGNSDCVQIK